ncbi:MAG TPA: glutamine amidotransferase [Vicinamibacterales bacterium]|nr:glutamine amidotransferase [Vicinamibacterales bacterium]
MVQFAVALPWWGYGLAFAAALAFAWLAYSHVAIRMSRGQRTLLTTLRAVTLVLIVIFLLRPVQFVQADGPRDSVVAVLVDVSRSMRLVDGAEPRIDRAREIADQLQSQLGRHFQTELLSFGETLSRIESAQLGADARRSDLSSGLTALAERYRGRRLAGVVVISDGGDTSSEEAGSRRSLGVPVYTVGVGSSSALRDREIVNFTAGEPLLAESSVDLSVSLTSTGFGTTPIEVRLSEDGRPLDTRRITPAADGATLHQVFTVSPAADRETVYTVSIPPDASETVVENNTRSVLVPPQGRRRRVLVVEGAPGFEHTFVKRALGRDPGLEVDSVVRKGQNEEGRDTFFIQAASNRALALATGYPTTRAALFEYDAVFFGNIEGDFFSRDQLALTADFVGTRGGGLLVFGARSFERTALAGTPLEHVLPVDLTDRRATAARTAGGATPAANAVALTPDGATHPATRLDASIDESQKQWAALPPLASVAGAGGPRPGAQVLAVTSEAGALKPLLVTQRYGQGRTMVFTGEASWRWRMMMPAADTTHERVWRQLARWVAGGAAERLEIPPTAVALPGTTEAIRVLVRDEEFKPIANAEVAVRVTAPGGEERTVPAPLAAPAEGRYSAAIRFDQPGVYRIVADVRRGQEALGSVSRSMLVGGVDVELTVPRLNESVLRRIADTSGGRYLPADDVETLPALIQQSDVGQPPTEMRDVWHNGFSLGVIVMLLAAEWLVRRRVGLA